MPPKQAPRSKAVALGSAARRSQQLESDNINQLHAMTPTRSPFSPMVSKFASSLLAVGFLLSPILATAETVTSGGKSGKEPVQPAPAESPYKFSSYLQGGFMGNFDDPAGHTNYGRLFDGRSNEAMFNQFAVTFEKVLGADGFDWGFKVQGMVGSDARFIHSLGLLDQTSSDLIQYDIVEAFVNLHFPIITEGGLDVKAGKFVTLEGAETINPLTNVFYSHTYSFNFGIPFNHTGALATLHVNKTLDVYGGVVRGVNTSIEDNNDSLAFHGGVGLNNLFGGEATVFATTHFGPETPGNDSDFRWLNDITAIVKLTDKLTAITDLNYAYDDAANAKAFGVAQYFTYALTDKLTLGVRAEVFRDDEGFFVGQYGDNADPVHVLEGSALASADTRGAGPNTYTALTAGVTWKLNDHMVIRPEFRWDHATEDQTFNDFEDGNMFTAGLDFIIYF